MLECTITETKDIEPVVYEWGAVEWVANRDLNPGCEQSFGLAHILPGKVNPEHWHTAAEEIVYMLQGECFRKTIDEPKRHHLRLLGTDGSDARISSGTGAISMGFV